MFTWFFSFKRNGGQKKYLSKFVHIFFLMKFATKKSNKFIKKTQTKISKKLINISSVYKIVIYSSEFFSRYFLF